MPRTSMQRCQLGLFYCVSRPPITSGTCRPVHSRPLTGGRKLTTELVEGDEVEAIVECMQRNQSGLLVLGLHRHSLLLSRVWNHTAYDLVQRLSGSILG